MSQPAQALAARAPLACVMLLACASGACLGHRFSPSIRPSVAPDPTIATSDAAVSFGIREDGFAISDIIFSTKPAALAAALARQSPVPASASAPPAPATPHRLIDDILIALDAVGVLSEGGSDALPLASLGLRTGYQSDWFAADLGIAWTSFTFVLGLSAGPRFELPIGTVAKIRGDLALYGTVPLDATLGYRMNGDLIGPNDGVRPRATAGSRARLGFGLAVSPTIEIRAAFMGGAALNGRDPVHLEAAGTLGLGGTFGRALPTFPDVPALRPGDRAP